jgi:hypothetical protein
MSEYAGRLRFTYGLIVVFFVLLLGLVAWGMIAFA